MAIETSLEGKKLLLLSGVDSHSKVVDAAHELGAYVIVADYYDVDDAPAKLLADESWLVDVMDVDDLIRRSEEAGIDGVLNFCLDAPQKPYQKVAEHFGLPCYGDEKQFAVLTDKVPFKEFADEHGLLTVPTYTEEEALHGDVPFPLIVKPDDGRGSRGQTICRAVEELPAAIAHAKETSKEGGVIIERYLENAQDFSLSCMIIDGVPYPLKMGDRSVGTSKDGLERQHICTISPSRHFERIMEETFPRVQRFISDLGIRFGALFLQGRIEDGKVYFYDPGLRLPGSDFDLIIKEATGFDAMRSAVRFALTGDVESRYGDPEDAYLMDGKVGFILSVAGRPGTISRMDGIEEVRKDPRTVEVSIRHHVGDTIEPTGDTTQRMLEFSALLPDRESIGDYLDFVYDTLSITDEYGDDMIVSKASFVDDDIEIH